MLLSAGVQRSSHGDPQCARMRSPHLRALSGGLRVATVPDRESHHIDPITGSARTGSGSETEQEHTMKNLKKKAAVTGIIATTLAFGGAGLAMAANPDSTAPSSSSSSTDEQDPSYTGTVPAPQDATAPDGTDTELSEADEAASLQGLATVTPEQATAAALAAVPGTAGDAVLEDENGYVVYEVKVTGADGSVIEVKVDAGDASVLAQEADEAEGADEADENGTEAQDETGENGAEDPNN